VGRRNMVEPLFPKEHGSDRAVGELHPTGPDRGRACRGQRHLGRGDRGGDVAVRPIMPTAISTMLGMISIAPTIFLGPMAFAIMGGLLVATVLTLIFLPALYVTSFRLREPLGERTAPRPRLRMPVHARITARTGSDIIGTVIGFPENVWKVGDATAGVQGRASQRGFGGSGPERPPIWGNENLSCLQHNPPQPTDHTDPTWSMCLPRCQGKINVERPRSTLLSNSGCARRPGH
jgi:hypothetical protein